MTQDDTSAGLLHAITSASDHRTARLVLDRLDLEGPSASDVLLGLLLQTVGARTTAADDAVVITFSGHVLTVPVHDGEAAPEPGAPAWEELAAALSDGGGALLAERTGAGTGPESAAVHERLAWDVTGGWAWPAHGQAGAVAGPDLWRPALAEQQEEQRRSDRAVAVGAAVVRQVLALVPAGPATLRVIDAGPDRVLALQRDENGLHVSAGQEALDLEASLIGTPVAQGVGAVTLLLHTGEESVDGADLRGWRVEPEGVLALDSAELRHEFGPHWFDRHRGLAYLDAPAIDVP